MRTHCSPRCLLVALPLTVALPVLVAASSCRSGTPVQPDRSPGEPATVTTLTHAGGLASPSVAGQMRDHDAHGAALREAVARADLGAARREAQALADYRLPGSVGTAWRKSLDAMNSAAASVTKAKDLDEASRRLSAVAVTCGDCHATLGGPTPIVGEPPGEGSGVGAHMKRHQWAASRLWDGLVLPSDDAWRAGARVLAGAALEPERLTPGRSPVPAIGAMAAAVHDLGRAASVTAAPVDRAAAFAELMTTCAACHERLNAAVPVDQPR